MKIKRFIAITLVICLVSSFAFAEEEQGSVLDWLRNAWEDTKTWAGDTLDEAKQVSGDLWDSVKSWIGEKWGSASEWVEKTWNSSSDWITNIWGDASTWVTDTYNSVSESVGAWWIDVFNTVTEKTDKAMEWVGNESEAFKSMLSEKYKDISTAAGDSIANAGESIKKTYDDLLKKLNLEDVDIEKILETIRQYAAMINVSAETVATALLPYLVKLVIESTVTGKSIPAVAVAMFLTAVVNKMDITTAEQAQQVVNGFVERLGI